MGRRRPPGAPNLQGVEPACSPWQPTVLLPEGSSHMAQDTIVPVDLCPPDLESEPTR